MKEVINILKENSYGFLATVDHGKPRVRPFGFMFEEKGRLYFCTANTKEVYHQLLASPSIEYSSTTKDMVTARITGDIEFTEEKEMKEKVLNSNNLVKSIYKSADNPIFKIFYIEHGTAVISDFSGNPPKKFVF